MSNKFVFLSLVLGSFLLIPFFLFQMPNQINSHDYPHASFSLSAYTPSSPIYIDGNFSASASYYSWPGSGIVGDPYVISGLSITGPSNIDLITIRNSYSYFKIDNCYLSGGKNGIYIYYSANGIITNSFLINNVQQGISSYYSGSNYTISNNIITGNGYSGIIFYSYQDYGPGQGNINIKVLNNTISSNIQHGINFYSVDTANDNILVKNNTINGNVQNGIYYYAFGSSTINHNRLEDNVIESNKISGIRIVSSGVGLSDFNNTFKTNQVRHNEIYGIHYSIGGFSANITFESNVFENNSLRGLSATASQNNPLFSNITYSNNEFLNNKGYGLYNGIRNASIVDNRFVDNEIDGLYLSRAEKSFISNNMFYGSGVFITGTVTISDYVYYFSNNLVNDKSLIYLLNANNLDIPPEIGQVIIINSTFITISDQIVTYSGTAPIFMKYSANITLLNMTLYGQSVNGVFFENTDNITITDSSVTNARNGIYGRSSNNVVIEFNVLSNNYNGLDLNQDSNMLVQSNTIWNNTLNGIGLYTCNNVYLAQNTVFDNYFGINSTSVYAGITVNQNTIYNNDFAGIALFSSENMILTNNTLTNNEFYLSGNSIIFFNSHTILDNTVNGKELLFINNEFNKTYSSNAGQIFIVNSSLISIKNQNISNVNEALVVFYSDNVDIWNNTFENNAVYAIRIDQNSQDISIYSNDFINNGWNNNQHQVYDDGTNNIFFANYWSDLALLYSDDNNDGFLDYPYSNIDGNANSVDLFPLGQSVFTKTDTITTTETTTETIPITETISGVLNTEATTITNIQTITEGEDTTTITETATDGFTISIFVIGVILIFVRRKWTKN